MAVSQVDELTGGKVTQYSQAAKSKLQSWATWFGAAQEEESKEEPLNV